MTFSVNHPLLYVLAGIIVAVVLGQSVYFLVKALRRSKAIGMDQAKIRKTIRTAAVFTIAPAVSVVISVIALSKTLGLPLPWLRLSVVGSLSYEAIAAGNALSAMGLELGKVDALTAQQFVNITLVMTISILVGIWLVPVIGKKLLGGMTNLGKRDGKATIGVEEVRLFREDMYLSPTESLYKIYVIEEAEKLTVNAQNALLTVLEEPPKNVIILLLAESGDKILTTVKSRTQAVAMQRFESNVMRSYLTAHNEKAALYEKTDPKALEGIIMSADGRIGAALSLLSDKEAKENKKSRDATKKIVSALESGTPYEHLHSAIIDLPTSRVEFCEAIEELMSAVRDVMLLKLDQNLPLTFYTSRDDAARAGEKMSVKRLMSIYELLRDAYEDASKNVGIAATAAKLGARIKLI